MRFEKLDGTRRVLTVYYGVVGRGGGAVIQRLQVFGEPLTEEAPSNGWKRAKRQSRGQQEGCLHVQSNMLIGTLAVCLLASPPLDWHRLAEGDTHLKELCHHYVRDTLRWAWRRLS